MRTRKYALIPLPRDLLERLAYIMGDCSAAAAALTDAESHKGPVRFYRHGPSIVVEKL